MTLFELLMVVAIVAILGSIAFPAYSRFTQQVSRRDATSTLRMAARSLERCYSRTFEYSACNVDGTVMNNGSTMTTPNLLYQITFTIPDSQSYTLKAVAIAASQTKDTRCTQFTLSSTGTQTAQDSNANPTTKACWGSN
jgi:type IV pilus assembly protein PilE